MNIFENASRNKLRFPTSRGELTVEQIWDLPLTSTKGLSLNEIGTGIQKVLREMGEDSLIRSDSKDPEKTKASLRLDLIKHVIEVKQAENAAERAKADRKAEKERLLELLARKQDQQLETLTEEEIKARLEAL